MIICIDAHNVNQAFSQALELLTRCGEASPSRVGDVIAFPEPVVTTYRDPTARVMFSPMRDCNPFFHVVEGLWMLAGRNDLATPQRYVSTFGQFSDDGVTLHGAYGFRWRHWFGYDQLEDIIIELRNNPSSRRCVLSMWDAGGEEPDLHTARNGGKDVPCNTHIYFDARDGKLNMTVCNRSNDAVWGLYGANAVHMSMLLEYVTAAVGLPVGRMTTLSNNLHVYTERDPRDTWYALADDARQHDRYTVAGFSMGRRVPWDGAPKRVPLVQDVREFNVENDVFLNKLGTRLDEHVWTEPFLAGVAVPLDMAWTAYKAKDYETAALYANRIEAEDWRIAATEWLNRRAARRAQKEQGK